jgi:hypothetical protein
VQDKTQRKKGLWNEYHLLAVYEGFHPKTDFSQQADNLSVLWERGLDFYDSIIEYYENNPHEGLVVYNSTDDCNSEVGIEYSHKGALND